MQDLYAELRIRPREYKAADFDREYSVYAAALADAGLVPPRGLQGPATCCQVPTSLYSTFLRRSLRAARPYQPLAFEQRRAACPGPNDCLRLTVAAKPSTRALRERGGARQRCRDS